MFSTSKSVRWTLFVGLVLVVLAVFLVVFHKTATERPLTTIGEIHHWNATEGAPRPVRLRAVVVYYDPAWRMLNVQNGDLGLFFDPNFQNMDLRPGTVVNIKGITDPKAVISQLSIAAVGKASLPTPVATTIQDVAAGKNSGILVRVKGVVRWVKTLDSRITLKLASAQGTLNVRILGNEPSLLRIPPDSLVEAVGVASPPSASLRSGEIFATDSSSIKVLQAGPQTLFSLPVTPVESLTLQRASSDEPVHAVHVREKVTGKSSDGDWIIGSTRAQAHVRPLERLIVQDGDLLDVVGFPASDGGVVALADAMVRMNGSGSLRSHTLTTAAEVTNLDPGEAAAAIPVKLNASVTFFDPWWRLLFVEDQTGGIYVEDVPPNLNLHVGDLVTVAGESRSGGFIPDIAKPTIAIVGRGKLPPAPAASQDGLMQGKYDSARVKLTGIVRGVSYNPDQKRMVLDVVSGNTLVKAQLLTPEKITEDPTSLVDSRVELVGIVGTLLNQNMQMVGISLFVQDKSDLKVLEPGPEDPFALPQQEIGALLRFRASSLAQHRVHVSGVVLMQNGTTLYIRDTTGAIGVRTMKEIAAPPGTLVRAAGFVSPGESRPVLVSSLVQLRGTSTLPAPNDVSPDSILKGGYDSELVKVEGTVLSGATSPRGWEVLLQQGTYTFNAVLAINPLRETSPAIQPGTLVRITGIAETQPNLNNPDGNALSFRILMRDRSDLKILRRPPWWSLERFLAFASVLIGIVVIAFAWVLLLKRQVRRQTALIQQQTLGLLRSEKLASIGQLVTGVAHELNNPLAAVIGYSDLLGDELDSERHRDMLDKLGREARRMKRIIDDLVRFARPSATGRAQTDLEEVIRGAMRLQEASLRAQGVTVELSFQPGLPMLELDENQLKQVFLNLFSNAAHALTDVPEKHIWVIAQVHGSYVVVRVRDTGRGFDDPHKAFDPFYTTKPVGQGPGLGLSICYGIVKEHGGKISVQNLQPTGAMVVIKLPIPEAKRMTAGANGGTTNGR